MEQFSEHSDHSLLTQGKPVPANSITQPFNPISSERKIILTGRQTQQASISYDKAHKVVLPNISHLSDLFIEDNHEQTKHRGASEDFIQLRQKTLIFSAGHRTKVLIFKHTKNFQVKLATQILAFRHWKKMTTVIICQTEINENKNNNNSSNKIIN